MALDILVPYWGEPDLMRLTVQSVLAQDSDQWRLTVVDDAYPDPQIHDWLVSLGDPRITVVRHATNVGITANYRECLARATQDWVVFLGCDDVLLPRYVSAVLGAVAAFPEAVMVQPGVEVIDESGQPTTTLVDRVKRRLRRADRGRRALSGEPLAVSLLRGNWLYWPSLALRRDAVDRVGFRVELPIIQDFALELDLVAGGAVLVDEPTVCFRYRRHRHSASATTLTDGTRFADERTYYAMVAEQMRDHGWPRAARAARWRLTSRAHALALLPGAVARRQGSGARALARHALR